MAGDSEVGNQQGLSRRAECTAAQDGQVPGTFTQLPGEDQQRNPSRISNEYQRQYMWQNNHDAHGTSMRLPFKSTNTILLPKIGPANDP